MATETTVTGLYPISPELLANPEQINKRLFFLKSSNVKVFPSSWRGARLITTGDGLTAEQAEAQFDIESALNTEYNITHTAGAIKTCIDEITTRVDIDTGRTLYSFKFYLNGYLFEITDLDMARCTENPEFGTEDNPDASQYIIDTTLPENLYAYIRVGNLINDSLYEASIDFTRVLMPFSWTDLTAPTQLDATINTIYSMHTPDWDSTYARYPLGGIAPEDLGTDVSNDVYLFTGIALTTDPNYTAQNNNLAVGDNYYCIQLVIDGQLNKTLGFPTNVKAGQAEDKSSIVIGHPGLIAEDSYSVAMGRYNNTTKTDNEDTLLVIGNGHNNTWRRNVLNITGYVDPVEEVQTIEDTYIPKYSQTVAIGPLKVKYNSELEANQLGVNMDNLYTLNDGIKLAADGSHIIINMPSDDDLIGKDVANAGIHLFGGVNLIGENQSIAFKETPTMSNKSINQKIIAAIDITNTTNGKGLNVSNLRNVNGGMITFRPNASAGGNNSVETINKQITISPDGQSVAIGINSDIGTLQFGSDSNTALVLNRASMGDGTKQNSISNIHKLNSLKYLDTTDSVTISNEKDKFTLETQETTIDSTITKLTGKVIIDGDIEIGGKTSFKNTGGSASGDGSSILNENPGLQQAIKTLILETFYPVGSIYMSMDTTNPGTRFGGTWERISQGRVLLGAGKGTDTENEIRNFTKGTEGGRYEGTVLAHTHGNRDRTLSFSTGKTSITPASHIFTHNHTVTSAPASGAHSHELLTADYVPTSDCYINKAKIFDRLCLARRVMVGYCDTKYFNSAMLTGVQKDAPSWADTAESTDFYQRRRYANNYNYQYDNDKTDSTTIVMDNDRSAHTHNFTLTSDTTTLHHAPFSHDHSVNLSLTGVTTLPSGKIVGEEIENSNLPPYLVCAIWKRTK